MKNTKLIVINADIVKEMTFDEVYNQYKNLLNKRIRNWLNSYEYDDLIQVASIGLWKAYENYDKPVAFGMVAAVYIDNEILKYNRKNKPKFDNKSSVIKSFVSMESEIHTGKNGDEIKLEDMLGEEDRFANDITDRIVLQKILSKFTDKQKKDIEQYINGYSFSEIAESKDESKIKLSNQIKNNFMKLRSLYISEMML